MSTLQYSRSNQKTMFKPAPLSVSGVFSKLREIATLSGASVSFCASIAAA